MGCLACKDSMTEIGMVEYFSTFKVLQKKKWCFVGRISLLTQVTKSISTEGM